jgi:hypothetical protein
VLPSEEALCELLREPLGLAERRDQEPPEEFLDRARVGLSGHERAAAQQEPVGRERVDVGAEREPRAERLDRRDEAGGAVLPARAPAAAVNERRRAIVLGMNFRPRTPPKRKTRRSA